ncbi:MAG: RNA pseudouridine synthase [Pseudonocardiales bacterium]|nr:MAG: RNA pseudouridine synthase [Pseudonocardiales bacterium]
MSSPTTSHRSLPVPDGLDGLRLDAALVRLFGFSRGRAASLVDGGTVLVDGARIGKGDRVHAGAWLELELPDERPATAPPAPVVGLSIGFEDDDVVVVDKPAGVAAHPSPGWDGPTVTGGLAAMGVRVASGGAPERAGVVHRLDVGTTGLMVLAKSERAYSVLKQAFRQRAVDKRYRALAQGHPDPTDGTIDAPIDRHPTHDWRFAVVSGGRPSVTHYRTIEAFRAASLLDVGLETGRTHQIRVHLAAVRHPLVGDLTYGADPTLAGHLGLARQWLHAASLSFDHPRTGERVLFQSPDPADLAAALGIARGES